MTGISVRALKYADIPEVRDMIAALAAHHGDEATLSDADLIRLSLGQESSLRIFVAEGPDGALGYSAIGTFVQLHFGRTIADLHHLFVKENTRGTGVGRALITHACAWARDAKCTALVVGTAAENTEAHVFYQNLGFTKRPVSGPRFAVQLEEPQGLEDA